MTASGQTSDWGDEEADEGPPPLEDSAWLASGYRVVTHLRRGEDLDVYDLWSEERACRCVGKTLRPDCDNKPVARRRLTREWSLLARLTHPHIVRAYEMLSEPRPVLVLETLPGETLSHLIGERPRRLPVADIAHLGLHLCSAVQYLHHRGVLHLDLKPSNIVASHGMAKLLDLSIARAPGKTRGGLGTPGYMAPEQAHGGLLGPHTDVWGMGAVLYEAATGWPACEVDDLTRSDVLTQIDFRVEPVRRHRRVPTAFAAVIEDCLAPEPKRRPTVARLADTLTGLIAN